MSEQEIIKHAKNIISATGSKEEKLGKRLLDILVEIIIIIVAVSVSFLVERWREHNADRRIERNFLVGLTKDFDSDLEELRGDSTSYAFVQRAMNYYLSYDVEKNPAPDSLKHYYGALFRSTILIPNTSRIDALKFSGKMDVIEDKELLDKILNIYQEKIPALIIYTKEYTDFKYNELIPYIRKNSAYSNKDRAKEILSVLGTNEMKNYLDKGTFLADIIDSYHELMAEILEVRGDAEKFLEK